MTQQQLPMYFGDLFAEIESNVNHPHPPPAPPPSVVPPPAAGPPTHLDVNAASGVAGGASADMLAFSVNMPTSATGNNNTNDKGGVNVNGESGIFMRDVNMANMKMNMSMGMDIHGNGNGKISMTPAEAAEAERMNGKRRKQELHRRHSKRYRDNLGELFHELELILPQVVPDCKLKTKSQIIATSVNAVKQLKSEVSALEIRYVMSSASNRARWVEDTVANANIIQDAIEPFMRLLLGLQSWKHAELWMNLAGGGEEDGGGNDNGNNNNILKLERVSTSSEKYASNKFSEFIRGSQIMEFHPGDDSLVGRIATSLQPEWLDLTNESACAGFKRGQLAIACGLCVCFAVPFLVRGRVVSVVLFYDNTPRSDVLARVHVAQTLASNIGNCFGASTSKNNSNSNSNANANTANGISLNNNSSAPQRSSLQHETSPQPQPAAGR